MKLGLPAIKNDEYFTYAQYKTWPDDERWELIHGVAYNMCAAPSVNHQGISSYLHVELGNFLKGKRCKVFAAPFDVLLPEFGQSMDESENVVQPDIVVICDKDKLNPANLVGSPTLVIEILSPSTTKKDLNEKFKLFEAHAVPEYWVIDPSARWFCRYNLNDQGAYDEGLLLEREGRLESLALPGFSVDIADCFASLEW